MRPEEVLFRNHAQQGSLKHMIQLAALLRHEGKDAEAEKWEDKIRALQPERRGEEPIWPEKIWLKIDGEGWRRMPFHPLYYDTVERRRFRAGWYVGFLVLIITGALLFAALHPALQWAPDGLLGIILLIPSGWVAWRVAKKIMLGHYAWLRKLE